MADDSGRMLVIQAIISTVPLVTTRPRTHVQTVQLAWSSIVCTAMAQLKGTA